MCVCVCVCVRVCVCACDWWCPVGDFGDDSESATCPTNTTARANFQPVSRTTVSGHGVRLTVVIVQALGVHDTTSIPQVECDLGAGLEIETSPLDTPLHFLRPSVAL